MSTATASRLRFDMMELRALQAARLVDLVADPASDLLIANYTAKAQYDNAWADHPILLDCRGTVIAPDGTVHAKPFRKFFNLGERSGTSAEELAALGTPDVSVKRDGSMITAWLDTKQGRVRFATRGSFTSDQAKAAEAIWIARYADVELDSHYTYVFEYTAPNNRIVVAYPDAQLTLIGLVKTVTGRESSYGVVRRMAAYLGVPGVVVENIDWATAHTLERPNFEGFVLHWSDGTRVKVKLADYVRLHRLITGLNERTIWEALSTGTLEAIRSQVPEEFLPWIDDVVLGLHARYTPFTATVEAVISQLGALDPTNREDRKRAAAHIVATAPPGLHAACFMALDGKDPAPAIWKILEPRALSKTAMAVRSES